MDLGPYEYTIARIDGDYAYLLLDGMMEEKCVARALLPEGIVEVGRLHYENLQYEMME